MKYVLTMMLMMVSVASLAQAKEYDFREGEILACHEAGHMDFDSCVAYTERQRNAAPSATMTEAPAPVSTTPSGVSNSEFDALRDLLIESKIDTDARLDRIEADNRAKDDELERLRAENERLRAEREEREALLRDAATAIDDSNEALTASERMYRDLIAEVEAQEYEAPPRYDSTPARERSTGSSIYGSGRGSAPASTYSAPPVPSVGYAPPVPTEETVIYLHQPRTVAGMSWDDCVDSRQCMSIYNQSPWPIEIDLGDGSRMVVDQRYGMPSMSTYETPTGQITLIPPRTYAFVFLGFPKESVYPRVTAYAVNYGFYVPFRELNMGKKRVYSSALDVRKDMPWNMVSR